MVVEHGQLAAHGVLGVRVERVAALAGIDHEYLEQLVRAVVFENDAVAGGETALEAAVARDERLHLKGVACRDAHELAAVVLQALDQRLQRLRTIAAVRELVGLVDEEDAAHGRVDDMRGDGLRVALEAADQLGLVHLNHGRRRQRAHRIQDLAHQAGDRGLARAGIAQEQVMAQRDIRPAALEAGGLDLVVDRVRQLRERRLHSLESHEFVQLSETVVNADLLRFLIRNIVQVCAVQELRSPLLEGGRIDAVVDVGLGLGHLLDGLAGVAELIVLHRHHRLEHLQRLHPDRIVREGEVVFPVLGRALVDLEQLFG